MEPEGKAWDNADILREIFATILRDIYKRAEDAEFQETLRELLSDANPTSLQRVLLDLQVSPLMELVQYLEGDVDPLRWPGIDVVNAATRESLSMTLSESFGRAHKLVDDEFVPPIDRETARSLDMSRLQELWERMLCPVITGIIFGNDEILYLDLPSLSPTPFPAIEEIGRVVEPTVASRSSVREFIAENGEDFTVLDELVRERIHARNLALAAGGTSMGSEGFVAVLTLDTQEILWIAIFANSNPFVSVSYDASNDAVIAITSHEHVWKFPLTQPEKLQVSYLNW